MTSECVVCNQISGQYYREISTDQEYKIYKCSNCGLEYTYPIPTDSDLEKFYTGYNDILASKDISNLNAQEKLKTLQTYGLNSESLMLDFGCGNGEFVDAAGSNCYGIDLRNIENKRIYKKLQYLPINRFDFISLWGVLEHINDLLGTLIELAKYLKAGGYLALTTVNAEGRIPYYYKPPEHLTYWTKSSIKILAENLGLKVIKISDYNMIQYSEIYLDRLLSRTPKEHADVITHSAKYLPEIITVPTNEFFVLLQK